MKTVLFIGFLMTAGIYILLDTTFADLEDVVENTSRLGMERHDYAASNTTIDAVVWFAKAAKEKTAIFVGEVWGSVKTIGFSTAGRCKRVFHRPVPPPAMEEHEEEGKQVSELVGSMA